ncbi:hypothetical protein OIU74_002899 [Salix koriyanagi]|uniref:Glycine-rich protein n=1 Tax=Salix koriyanagi TaxID=2511006 RepID=A0A9Q0ZKH5_9ROSI|nr:hypothetical protein OIU74_002899 [Salix koriyanagi]
MGVSSKFPLPGLIVLSIASALNDISYEGDMGDESSYGGRSGWKFDNDNSNDDCYKNWRSCGSFYGCGRDFNTQGKGGSHGGGGGVASHGDEGSGHGEGHGDGAGGGDASVGGGGSGGDGGVGLVMVKVMDLGARVLVKMVEKGGFGHGSGYGAGEGIGGGGNASGGGGGGARG